MKRRRALLAIPAALAVGRAARAYARERLTITVGGDGMHFLPIYTARAAGFYADEGLDVDWVDVGSGTRVVASLMGGSADLGPVGLFHVIKSQNEGGDLVAFSALFDLYAMSIVLSNEAMRRTGINVKMPIDQKVAALSGLTIGLSSPGSSTDQFIRSLLLARGMDPDRSLRLQPFGSGPSILAAFQRKLTDGFVFPAPFPAIAQARGLGTVVIDPFTGELPELRDVPYIVAGTSRATLARRPDVMRGAVRALTRAIQLQQREPAETARLVRPYFPELEPSLYASVVEAHRRASAQTPIITETQVARTAAWMDLTNPTPVPWRYDAVVAAEPALSTAGALLR